MSGASSNPSPIDDIWLGGSPRELGRSGDSYKGAYPDGFPVSRRKCTYAMSSHPSALAYNHLSPHGYPTPARP